MNLFCMHRTGNFAISLSETGTDCVNMINTVILRSNSKIRLIITYSAQNREFCYYPFREVDGLHNDK
jgi:hypothetical protein